MIVGTYKAVESRSSTHAAAHHQLLSVNVRVRACGTGDVSSACADRVVPACWRSTSALVHTRVHRTFRCIMCWIVTIFLPSSRAVCGSSPAAVTDACGRTRLAPGPKPGGRAQADAG